MLPRPTSPIRVALCIGDEALRERVVNMFAHDPIRKVCNFSGSCAGMFAHDPVGNCTLAGVVAAAGAAGADLVLADRPPDTPAPVIAFARAPTGNSAASAWLSDRAYDVRAVVPFDMDATLLGAVIAIVAGGFIVTPHWAKRRARTATGSWAEMPDRAAQSDEIPALTPREREVLALLAEGASNKAIARALSISVHTVKFHVASLSEKLGASGRLEAVAIAIRSGLIMV
jgi:DNA-binding CsgD family transcriptional regulator